MIILPIVFQIYKVPYTVLHFLYFVTTVVQRICRIPSHISLHIQQRRDISILFSVQHTHIFCNKPNTFKFNL